MISARTKAGLAAAKARGTKLGIAARRKSEVREIAAMGAKAKSRSRRSCTPPQCFSMSEWIAPRG